MSSFSLCYVPILSLCCVPILSLHCVSTTNMTQTKLVQQMDTSEIVMILKEYDKPMFCSRRFLPAAFVKYCQQATDRMGYGFD